MRSPRVSVDYSRTADRVTCLFYFCNVDILSCCCYPYWLHCIGVVGRMSGKPLLLLEVFSGESKNWGEWIEHFESVATMNKWATDNEKLKWLNVRLTGTAWMAFRKLPANVQEKYGECLKVLKQRFDPNSKKDLCVAEVHTHARRIDEDWASYGDALSVLADKAYSDLEEKARERLALTQFLVHIENRQVAFGVRQKRPETVEATVVATIKLESYLNIASSAQRVISCGIVISQCGALFGVFKAAE